MDAIHFQILKFQDDNYKHEQLWSIVKSIVWSVNKNWKNADKGIWEFKVNLNICIKRLIFLINFV